MDNNLRSLSSLFSQPLDLENGPVKIDSILIPKIQRAYAQGRRSEKEIRNGFLSDLFHTLLSSDEKELNFIYGSVDEHGEKDTRLVLLDGQQRLTTLWLLTWYLFIRENKPLPSWMKTGQPALFYDTRDTTSEFTQLLISGEFDFPKSEQIPSVEIKKAAWFSGDLHDDPSVDSMLRMIDSIHDLYNLKLNERRTQEVNITETEEKIKNLNIAESLDKIKFYVQPLENFGLTEDLYIKMNARGLQLRPFENFKADIVEWTLRNCQRDLYESFIRLIDRQMTDFFYNSVPEDKDLKDNVQRYVEYKDKEYNARFFRFFIRYFVWCRAIDSNAIENTRVFIGKNDPVMNFFQEKSEKEQDERYLGFSFYEDMLVKGNTDSSSQDESSKTSIEVISSILKHLDNINDILPSLIIPSWEKTTQPGIDFFSSGLQQRPFTILGGLFSFLSRIPKEEKASDHKEELRKWMRVVNNIAENTDIDNLAVMSNVMRQFEEFASLPGFIADVYKTISSAAIRGNSSRAVIEEIKKVAYIHADAEWEQLFLHAEGHPLLRGMILFFIPEDVKEGMDKVDFSNRCERISELFDADGISPYFKENALLLRAIIAELAHGTDAWSESNGIYRLNLTQYDGADRALRNNLSKFPKVSSFVRKLTSLKSKEEMKEYLEKVIDNPINADYLNQPEWTPYLKNAVSYLLSSPGLYKWIEDERANSKRIVRIDWSAESGSDLGQILVAVPRAWYAKVNIDTNRHLVMKSLLEDDGFFFNSPNEKEFMEKYENVFDSAVWMIKDYDDKRLTLKFTRKPSVEIHISEINEETGPETLQKIILPDKDALFSYTEICKAINDCIQ